MSKRLFKTLVAVLAIAAAAAGPVRAQSNTVTWTNYNMPEFDLSSQGDRQTIDDVTITSNGGSAGDNGNIYFDGAFTFSVPVGSVLTQIVIRDDTWLGVDDNNTGWSRDEHQTQITWTGSARSVACQITAFHVQYFEFTIAPAVPQMYTSEVSITDLVPGDTLAEGATIIGSGNDYDMVFLGAGRTKENGVVPSFWTDLGLPPTVIGTNGTISRTNTYTPVDGNGHDGNAWVVTSAELNYDDGFQVGLAGITIPVKLDSIPADWTVKVAGVTQTLQTYDGGNPKMRWLKINENDSVTLIPDNPRRVKSVTLEDEAVLSPFASVTTEDIGKIIGADGNIYDNAAAATAAGTTASAIIAYVGTAGSVDESSSTYKGLAIALTDANNGSTFAWCTETGGTCVSQTNAIATAITYKNGIASTNTLTSDGHTHAAATAASSYSTARPSDVSAWFLPSMGQWNLIVQGLATKKAGSTVSTNLTTSENSAYQAANLNTVITAAGGTSLRSYFYWTSTESSTSNAWRMRFNFGDAYGNNKTSNSFTFVRAVFAF